VVRAYKSDCWVAAVGGLSRVCFASGVSKWGALPKVSEYSSASRRSNNSLQMAPSRSAAEFPNEMAEK
jgi:hypothetical protein